MKKYLTLFHINWQNSLQYRFSLVIYIAGYSLYIWVLLYLWSTVYHEGNTVGNYTLSQLTTYYLLQLMINSVIFSYISWDVIDNIKDGHFSNFLIKPLDYFLYWFTVNLSGKILEAFFVIIAAGLISLLFGGYFAFPGRLITLLYFLISVILGIVLAFEMDFCVGMITFWLTQVRTFKYMLQTLILFFAGAMLPLDLFPGLLMKISNILPFQYLVFFPISLYLGKVDNPWPSFIMLSVWILIFYVIARILLIRGIRRYEAVGA
ncbi:MAG: ABC-2 family transporter protein [Nitrospirae bacterium]|nr:ABC-2 family transporter protein [Nitrospirota bacterium]